MSDVKDQTTVPPSSETEGQKAPTVWTFLGSIVVGVLALGWVALWLLDAGTCSLEGIIWECRKGALVTEVNVVIAGFLVLVGTGSILRGILGLMAGAWKERVDTPQGE